MVKNKQRFLNLLCSLIQIQYDMMETKQQDIGLKSWNQNQFISCELSCLIMSSLKAGFQFKLNRSTKVMIPIFASK